MGMPCQINSILKLSASQYPAEINLSAQYQVTKEGYRIFPLDVPLQLVDRNWVAHADVIIHKLTWESTTTTIVFSIDRIYPQPFSLKD